MDFTFIHNAILDVYTQCNIYSFPFDCYKLLSAYKLKCRSYSSQTPINKEKCFNFSNDAFTIKNVVFYNDTMPAGRIKFTLMHELAHYVLKHVEPFTEAYEIEANYFASHILAPRMAIHYSQCKNYINVAKFFNITNEAAQYAFDDYRRWHRWTVYHKMKEFDKAVYTHFYSEVAKCFVYNIKRCAYCDAPIYNSVDIACKNCITLSRSYSHYQHPDEDLLIAEGQWLYGGL